MPCARDERTAKSFCRGCSARVLFLAIAASLWKPSRGSFSFAVWIRCYLSLVSVSTGPCHSSSFQPSAGFSRPCGMVSPDLWTTKWKKESCQEWDAGPSYRLPSRLLHFHFTHLVNRSRNTPVRGAAVENNCAYLQDNPNSPTNGLMGARVSVNMMTLFCALVNTT